MSLATDTVGAPASTSSPRWIHPDPHITNEVLNTACNHAAEYDP